MKRISVLRHAKSSYDDPKLDDFDRPLSDRGWKAGKRMGREFGDRGISFDLILASSAVRVRETIDAVEQSFDLPQPIRFEPGLYLAEWTEILEFIRALPETVHSPLLIGHNPGLEQLLLALSSGDEHGLRNRIAEKYPTAAFASVELAEGPWKDTESGTGRISQLILPRDLDQ